MTADQRARDARYWSYVRQRLPCKGFRRNRQDAFVTAEVCRKLKPLKAAQRKLAHELSVAKMLEVLPYSIKDGDLTTAVLVESLKDLKRSTHQETLQVVEEVAGASCKVERIQDEIDQKLAAAKDEMRREMGLELANARRRMRTDMRLDLANARDRMRTEMEHELAAARDQMGTEMTHELAAARTQIRNEFRDELHRELAAAREQMHDEMQSELVAVQERVRDGVREEVARLRVRVRDTAEELDRQHDRGQIEIWENLALLEKQFVEGVDRSTASCEETRAENTGARALAAETRRETIFDQRDDVRELISSGFAEITAAVAEAHEELVSAKVVGGKERKTRRGGKGRGGRGSGSSKKKLGDGGGDRDPSPVPSDPGDAVG